jgi:hypothetical protein
MRSSWECLQRHSTPIRCGVSLTAIPRESGDKDNFLWIIKIWQDRDMFWRHVQIKGEGVPPTEGDRAWDGYPDIADDLRETPDHDSSILQNRTHGLRCWVSEF